MTTEEKVEYIERGIAWAIEHSEFGVADLSVVRRFCGRIGIDEDETQQYIALLAARGAVKTQVVGRSYYIIPT